MTPAHVEAGRNIRNVVVNKDMFKKSNNKEKNPKISIIWSLVKENADFSDNEVYS